MDDIKKIYDEFYEHAMHLLNDQEYQEMMDVIKDAPVKPYNLKKERLH